MAVTTATNARRIGGVPLSLKSLSCYVLNPDTLRAVTTGLARASAAVGSITGCSSWSRCAPRS
jgi:hypothetical protein